MKRLKSVYILPANGRHIAFFNLLFFACHWCEDWMRIVRLWAGRLLSATRSDRYPLVHGILDVVLQCLSCLLQPQKCLLIFMFFLMAALLLIHWCWACGRGRGFSFWQLSLRRKQSLEADLLGIPPLLPWQPVLPCVCWLLGGKTFFVTPGMTGVLKKFWALGAGELVQ